MELIQKRIHYMQEGRRTFDQFYLDEDINVPDAKEDVGFIVQGQASVKVEDIRPVENYVRVSGKLYYQILYITDTAEHRPAALEGTLPFEEMVYIDSGEQEQFYIENARTEFTASLVHSRKISVRAMLELEIGREILSDEETTTDIDSSIPVYKKMKQIALLGLHTTKKDTYRIKEEITLPGTKESIGQMLMTDVKSRRLEIRVQQDELILQGELLLFGMYLSEDGKTDWLEQSIPYTGRIACGGVEDGMYYHVRQSLSDTLIDIRLDEDGEMRVLGVEATLGLKMNIYREENIELLEDLYSLEQQCNFETRNAVYEELLLQNHSKCKIAERLSLPELGDDVLQICHSDGTIQVDHTEIEEGGIRLEGILHLNFLYLRANDTQPFGGWQGMVPFSWLLECQGMTEETRCDISRHVEQLSVNLAGNEAVEIKAVLAFDTLIRNPVTMQVITRVEFAPVPEEEIAKQPGIVGYIVKSGDELWTIAKKYHTTEDGIRQMNGLESERLKEGEKLLIFKENVSIL